jgi:hypothetical protein
MRVPTPLRLSLFFRMRGGEGTTTNEYFHNHLGPLRGIANYLVTRFMHMHSETDLLLWSQRQDRLEDGDSRDGAAWFV